MPSPCYLSVALCHESYRGFIIDSDDSAYYGFTEYRRKLPKIEVGTGKIILVDDVLVRPARWTVEGECINPYDTKKDIDPVMNENEVWPVLSCHNADLQRMANLFIRHAELLTNPALNLEDLTAVHKRIRQEYGHIMLTRHILEGDVRVGLTKNLNKKHVWMSRA